MAKPFRKSQARLAARKAAWDRGYGGKDGFKKPGSHKKPMPAGRGRSHAPKGI